jgi:hypothetical protein
MHLSAHLRLVPAAALSMIAIAACGGAGGNTNTNGNSAASGGGAQQSGAHVAYEYAACMRSHGLPNFPDPIIHESAGSESVGIHVTPAETSSPSFQPAQKACSAILPQGNSTSSNRQGPSLQEFVAFAQCLRTHGYPRFPDPNSQGQLPPQAITGAGINVNAPGFLATARGCLPALKGSVTAAQLAQAIKHIGAQSQPSQQGGAAGPTPSGG